MSIRNALAGLESEGITVPGADAYHAAISALSGAPAPKSPAPCSVPTRPCWWRTRPTGPPGGQAVTTGSPKRTACPCA